MRWLLQSVRTFRLLSRPKARPTLGQARNNFGYPVPPRDDQTDDDLRQQT